MNLDCLFNRQYVIIVNSIEDKFVNFTELFLLTIRYVYYTSYNNIANAVKAQCTLCNIYH